MFTGLRNDAISHPAVVRCHANYRSSTRQYTLPILDKDAYIKILLFGSNDLSSEENILLFRATQNFILNSDRFSQHNNIL